MFPKSYFGLCIVVRACVYYTGWSTKNNGTEYFLHHADAITAWYQYEATFPEKNDIKISNFGSVVSFLGYIL